MKKLFDRQPEIDVWSDKGNYIEVVEGTVEFRDVHFRYRAYQMSNYSCWPSLTVNSNPA